MPDQFEFDVFLSHSAKDNAVVRPLAERLKKDGIKVWFDDWEIRPGDSIPAKIEEGLEHSRVLVLCMSAHAFGSDWAQLEAGTFRFRDPLNKERRFLPLRLDDAPIKGSLVQFLYINWLPAVREQEYPKLIEACRPPAKPSVEEADAARKQAAEEGIQLDYRSNIRAYGFSPDGKRCLTGADSGNNKDSTLRLWDLETARCLLVFEGHTGGISRLAWSEDCQRVLTASGDKTARLWEVETGRSLRVFEGHKAAIECVAWSKDLKHALTGSRDKTVRLWEVATGVCLRAFEGHQQGIRSVVWSADQHLMLTGSNDWTVRVWDIETGRCLGVLEGHTREVVSVALSIDQRRALSGSYDGTVRLWDLKTSRCLRVLEGHTQEVLSVAWNTNQRYVLSGSYDRTVRLWDLERGRSLRVLNGHLAGVQYVTWSVDGRRAFSGDHSGGICVWDLSEFVTETVAPKVAVPASPFAPDQVQYTNAKVLLVGEGDAGKTGLSKRLVHGNWEPSDKTVGAWATQWKLPVSSKDGVEREVWLWDFGGQADQRLIHQLYMDQTALAVLVFDGQKADFFETLGQWDRDLSRVSGKAFTKLLTAGRVDLCPLRVSRSQVETFAHERGYRHFMETSAMDGLGCDELKMAILDGIRWEDIPWRSSPVLFKRLKDEIIRLKDEGRVLMRFNELRESLQLRLTADPTRFTDEELKAVISLLSGPGVVWELEFGSWVLLQPETINSYAQGVIKTIQRDEHERGCIEEERVLGGELDYHASMKRISPDEERIILLAMHQTLLRRSLCLRQPSDDGNVLIFPSFYRRERPELVGHPAVLVSYTCSGFLDDIYSTLVVRLHHTKPFEQDKLWRYAADFRTLTGKQLGVKLSRKAEGSGELVVYFDPTIGPGEKIIFSKYVHEHLLANAKDVVRLRHYVCPHCGTPVGNREVAMKKLGEGKKDILCVNCEDRVPLWDEMERLFASDEMKRKVQELERQSQIVLDNESKERALVGEVISTVALAGQLCREKNVSDHGIDMEIEFKDDASEATGELLYLQLKSGDSYLRERKSDGAEIFTIKDERHDRYWRKQKFPVLLVIRNSEGEVRWMEIRDYLRRASDNGTKPVKQIVFEGERFDVMSVRRWREKVLGTQ